MPLDVQAVRGILPRGGTILGSSRTNPLAESAARAAGPGWSGSRTTSPSSASTRWSRSAARTPWASPPGCTTKASRSSGCRRPSTTTWAPTDYTFGFDTAVNIAMEAIDRLHTTAESHHRALIVEVMGRHAGWIALHAGHGRRRERDPDPGAAVRHRPGLRVGRAPVPDPVRADRGGGRGRAPEGGQRSAAQPASGTRSGTSGYGGVGPMLASEIEKRTGKEARATVLGHVQRGGTPTAFDRVLATRFGIARDPRGGRGRVRRDGGPARHGHRPGAARARRPASSSWCRPSATPRPRSSSAEALLARRGAAGPASGGTPPP